MASLRVVAFDRGRRAGTHTAAALPIHDRVSLPFVPIAGPSQVRSLPVRHSSGADAGHDATDVKQEVVDATRCTGSTDTNAHVVDAVHSPSTARAKSLSGRVARCCAT
jgi:hypothetical protein